MKLSIIIPAYNEEKRIPPTLKGYFNFFQEKLGDDFEIIIIPNNCSDDTLGVSEKFSQGKEQIKILNVPYYVGKGGAVMKGFEIAKGDLIGFTDADNSTNPENFFKLYQNIKNNNGIIASRRMKGAVMDPPRTLYQQFSSFMFNMFARMLFGFKYEDTQCGAKIFTKKTAKFLSKNFKEIGWAFDVDLLYLCKKNNLEVLEHPIVWTDVGGSNLTFLDGVFSILKLFKIRFKKINLC